MLVPPKLQPGDHVGIIAPARKISRQQLEPAIGILEGWGLKPLLARNLFSGHHSYLAGTDRERRDDFQSMINDEKVRAIFCARGGYGSTRILEDIDFRPILDNLKWVIGFSDVTAFHLRLAILGVASMHATMPIFFGREETQPSVESIRRVLFDGTCEVEAPPSQSNRMGQARGPVIGGNLSLIVDALNTPSEPDTKGKILVIEEVDEYYYKLDRMLTQLRRTGKLKDLAALVVGHMTDIKNSDLDFGETVEQIITHAVRDYEYPVAFGFPTGHKDPNIAWIAGAEAVIEVSLQQSLLSYPKIYS